MRCALQKLCDEARVQRVSRAIGNQAAQHRLADQGEISEQVEGLVPNKLVGETKRGIVQHTGFRKHNRVLERSAPDQTTGLKLFHVMIKTECARRRNGFSVIRSGQLNFDTLLSDERVWKIDVILNAKGIGGVDAQRFLALPEHERLRNPDVSPAGPLREYARTSDRFRIGERTSVENRDFKVVQFDVGIVDSDTVQRRKKMFDCRNPNTPAHQRRGIGNSGQGGDVGQKLEIVQIDTAKNDAFFGGSWKNPHPGMLTRVEADSAKFDGSPERLLVHWQRVSNCRSQSYC